MNRPRLGFKLSERAHLKDLRTAESFSVFSAEAAKGISQTPPFIPALGKKRGKLILNSSNILPPAYPSEEPPNCSNSQGLPSEGSFCS
jgi:hypothetical protein